MSLILVMIGIIVIAAGIIIWAPFSFWIRPTQTVREYPTSTKIIYTLYFGIGAVALILALIFALM